VPIAAPGEERFVTLPQPPSAEACNILISVHTDDADEAARAKDIFKRQNAESISSSGESTPPRT